MTVPISGNTTAAPYTTEEIIHNARAKRAQEDIQAALAYFESLHKTQMTADAWFYKGTVIREAIYSPASHQKAIKYFKRAQVLWLAEKTRSGKVSPQAAELEAISKLLGESKLLEDAKALTGKSKEAVEIEKIRLDPPSVENVMSSELLKELNKTHPIQANILFAEIFWNAGSTHQAMQYVRRAISLLPQMPNGIRDYTWQMTDLMLICLQMLGDLYECRGLPQEAEYIYKLGISYSQKIRLPLIECQFMRTLCSLYINTENFSEAELLIENSKKLTDPLNESSVKKNEKLTGDFLRSLWQARELNPLNTKLLATKTPLCNRELLQAAKKHYTLAQAFEELIFIDYLEGNTSAAQEKWESLPSPRAVDLYHLGRHTKNPNTLKQALSICLKQGTNTPLIRDIYIALANFSNEPSAYHTRSIGVTADLQLQALKGAQIPSLFTIDPPFTLDLPQDWVAVSATICENSNLRITRWEGHKAPVSILITGSPDQFTLVEFESIIKKSNETLSRIVLDKQDKITWWSDRRALDMQLKQFLSKVEDDWLGAWKVLLAPHCPSAPSEKEAQELLYKALNRQVNKTAIDGAKARLLLASIFWLSPEQLAKGIHESLWQEDHDKSLFYTAATRLKNTVLPPPKASGYFPVTLLLGKHLQMLPWESLPILRKRQVTRMPSIGLMQWHLKERHQQKIAKLPNKTFYILNSSNNLDKTQTHFEKQFADRPSWEGVCAAIPSKEQFIKALTEYDLFVYCDHNTGELYLNRQHIEEKITKVRSIALLMGCGSGAMQPMGRYDPSSVVISYMLSSCPAVVGNLWNVTDGDIDRYLQKLLDLWVDQKNDDTEENRRAFPNDLLSSVSQSREACTLKYLVAAAPVVYGLPPHIKPHLPQIV